MTYNCQSEFEAYGYYDINNFIASRCLTDRPLEDAAVNLKLLIFISYHPYHE